MHGFEDIGSKGHFQPKRGVFGPKTPLGANENDQDATLCQVSEKSDAQISRYRVTHARTDERESIGPSAKAERPISQLSFFDLGPLSP